MSIFDRYERFADKTFRDAAEKYLADFKGKSRKRQEYALEHVLRYIGDLPLIEVDDTALEDFKRVRTEEAMAGTVNKELGTVTAVLNKAARVWRWIPSAPLIQRVAGAERKAYPLSWDEQAEVIGRLTGVVQKIAIFIVNTGLRREEVFKLRWDEERDIDGIMLFILRETKNGQDRPVICNSIARKIVEYMRGQHDEFVFPRVTLNKIFNQAWLLAGLPADTLVKQGVHNLRHTFGHRLRAAGVEPEDRDMLLGHHNKSLTQHYATPDIRRLAEMVERITEPRDSIVLR